MNRLINTKEPIVVCDIGASPVDATHFIDDLINNTNSILYGFEPNEDEFKKLNRDLWFCEKLFLVIGPNAIENTGFIGQSSCKILCEAQVFF